MQSAATLIIRFLIIFIFVIGCILLIRGVFVVDIFYILIRVDEDHCAQYRAELTGINVDIRRAVIPRSYWSFVDDELDREKGVVVTHQTDDIEGHPYWRHSYATPLEGIAISYDFHFAGFAWQRGTFPRAVPVSRLAFRSYYLILIQLPLLFLTMGRLVRQWRCRRGGFRIGGDRIAQVDNVGTNQTKHD